MDPVQPRRICASLTGTWALATGSIHLETKPLTDRHALLDRLIRARLARRSPDSSICGDMSVSDRRGKHAAAGWLPVKACPRLRDGPAWALMPFPTPDMAESSRMWRERPEQDSYCARCDVDTVCWNGRKVNANGNLGPGLPGTSRCTTITWPRTSL